MNILIHRALGGGGAASLRNDAQAKGFAQILLAQTIMVPEDIAGRVHTDTGNTDIGNAATGNANSGNKKGHS